MVNVSTSRISRRLAISSALMEVSIVSAKRSTSVGKSYGRPYSARIACISVLCSPGLPSTSVTFPMGESPFPPSSRRLRPLYRHCWHPWYFLFGQKNRYTFENPLGERRQRSSGGREFRQTPSFFVLKFL